MKKTAALAVFILIISAVLCLSACDPVDKNYATASDTVASEVKKAPSNIKRPKIMSDDKVMPQFVDISVFDEENYADIYLGRKFKFKVNYAGEFISVPTNMGEIAEKGWRLPVNSGYDEDSLIYANDTVLAVFENDQGAKITATFYNSSDTSIKMKDCNIVKLKIYNNFYINSEHYDEFNVNGVNNKMAVTDVIDTLGTPSHFYGTAENDYYLDYFISKKDRRNGITVYVNPVDDSVTAVEFSYYK